MRHLTREQVLGYRVAASGLWRETADAVALDVFDLGIQETNVGSARLALAARLAPGGPDVVADERFVLLWSFRGAPHLQRRDDLETLVRSLWPVSDAEGSPLSPTPPPPPWYRAGSRRRSPRRPSVLNP